MKRFSPIRELHVFYHRNESKRLLVGRLAYRESVAVFEYDPEFRKLGIELSPYKLPVDDGLLTAKAEHFEGLFGLFDDSLPDGWGRLLLERHVEEMGGDRAQLTPLDRLAWVGDRGMGALSYEPSHPIAETPDAIDLPALGEEMRVVLEDGASKVLEKLLKIGGSPQGARPKALVLVSASGDQIVSGSDHRGGFEPYLVKFPAKSDPQDSAGAIEYAFSRMARAAGVDMPVTRLLAPRGAQLGFFATRRFDRQDRTRLHTHTLSGLLAAPTGRTFTSYDDLMKVTFQLTKDVREVAQMLRRAAFNVYAHNRDDHSRNFAFIMSSQGTWSLAPAYDLAYAHGPGGEHSMTIAGEGRNPSETHLLALGKKAGIKERDAKDIVTAVRDACSRWSTFADEARVPKSDRDRIRQALGRLGHRRRG